MFFFFKILQSNQNNESQLKFERRLKTPKIILIRNLWTFPCRTYSVGNIGILYKQFNNKGA